MASPRFRLLATGAALVAWALVAVGGVVRVTASGLGCPHWPLCTSRATPLDSQASAIEYGHRAVVALTVALVVVVAVAALRTQRSRPDVLWPALVAAALVPLQALLGAIAVWLELPGWVVAFHFLVGLVFLATVVFTAAAAWRRPSSRATPVFNLITRASVIVGAALVSVGAAVVATSADAACGRQWPACNGSYVAGSGHASLQVAHRMLAYTLAALVLTLLILALRGQGPRLAGTLPALAVSAQIPLGVGIVLTADGTTHEVLSGMHEAGAGVVWALLVFLAVLVQPVRRSEGLVAAGGKPDPVPA